MTDTEIKHCRHDFSALTKRRLREETGSICANPDCVAHTNGPSKDGSGIINQGRAAHITAAAPGGPRYNQLLSEAERRHADNGIWLCTACASLIDDDDGAYPEPTLQQWKRVAREAAHLRVIKRVKASGVNEIDEASLKAHLMEAARKDLSKFCDHYKYTGSEVELEFSINVGGQKETTDLSGLAAGLSVNSELLIISAPGTGKTTSMIQLADDILASGTMASILLPMKEWGLLEASFIDTVLARNAFSKFSKQDLSALANQGELAFFLDGWNELGEKARARAVAQVELLRREFPLLCLIASTRKEATDVPFQGIKASLLPLSERRQKTLAMTLIGEHAATLASTQRPSWTMLGAPKAFAVSSPFHFI